MNEYILKSDALAALEAERKLLVARGMLGAEHILVHHGINVIDELPACENVVTVPQETMMNLLKFYETIKYQLWDELCNGECDYCKFRYTVPGTDERFDREPEYYCGLGAETDENYKKILGLD